MVKKWSSSTLSFFYRISHHWKMVLVFLSLSLVILVIYKRYFGSSKGRANRSIVFLHPYSHSMGGGERVLFTWISALPSNFLVETDEQLDVIVITGDKSENFQEIERRFQIDLSRSHITSLPLKLRFLLEAYYYPIFTLLGQALGSMIVGFEAVIRLLVSDVNPDVIIDTAGYAFSYPLFKLFFPNSSLIAYVHYPTISTDMLSRVEKKESSFNNRPFIARNPILSGLKLEYYKAFANLYGVVGGYTDYALVNSSWTENHIRSLWGSRLTSDRIIRIYPPCDVRSLSDFALSSDSRSPFILSVGQFRPEKNHQFQLKVFAAFREFKPEKCKLILIGGCRNPEDFERVQELKILAQKYGIEEDVQFLVNAPFNVLLNYLEKSFIGLHCMRDEHFGISIVEYMAAGLITVAHNSGGPKLDIIVNGDAGKVGYLAESVEEYVEALKEIFHLDNNDNGMKSIDLRTRARKHALLMFSEEKFKTEVQTICRCSLEKE